MAGDYRFSFGPWNIHEGADPFGPPVRPTVAFAKKLGLYKQLGFDGVQFHDDDAVPDLEGLSAAEVAKKAAAVKKMLDGEGLVAEFVAPRLWEHPNGIDGGFTANDPRVPPLGHRPLEAGDRHRQRPGHAADRPLAGPRGDLHPRVEERRWTRTAGWSRRSTRCCGTIPAVRNRHRAEAERADGPRLHPHDRPRPGPGPPDASIRAGWAG